MLHWTAVDLNHQRASGNGGLGFFPGIHTRYKYILWQCVARDWTCRPGATRQAKLWMTTTFQNKNLAMKSHLSNRCAPTLSRY